MARVLVGLLVFALPLVVCGCASELETAEKSLEQLTREKQMKTMEVKAIDKRVDDPKLASLRDNMLRLKTKLEKEISDLDPQIEAAKLRVAELKAQGSAQH